MKAKKLLFLSTTALALAACGPTVDLPKGYVTVDVNDSEQLEKFGKKLCDDLYLTYEKSLEGFDEELSFSFDEFSYEEDKKDGNSFRNLGAIRVEDFNIEMRMAENGKNITDKDLKMLLEVKNFGFKFSFVEDYRTVTSLKIDDLDFTIALADGNLYMDFSDSDISDAIDDIFEENSISTAKYEDTIDAIKEMFCGKYYIPDLFKFMADYDIDVDIPNISKLSKKDIEDAFTSLVKSFGTNKIKEILGMFTLADYPNSQAVAIGLDLDTILASNKLEALKDAGINLDGDLKMAIIFGEDGIHESTGLKGNLDLEVLEANKYRHKIVLDDLEIKDECDYGDPDIDSPNINKYKKSTLVTLLEMQNPLVK